MLWNSKLDKTKVGKYWRVSILFWWRFPGNPRPLRPASDPILNQLHEEKTHEPANSAPSMVLDTMEVNLRWGGT